jgi:hypothetical protein
VRHAPKEHVWNPHHGEDKLYDPPKFRVFKGWTDTPEEIGLDGEFFIVLRPERDKAGWDALWAYADAVEHRSPNLAAHLRDKLGEIRIKQGVRDDVDLP